MKLKRYDKKKNKKELWKLNDKMERLRYLFIMYGFTIKYVKNFHFNYPQIIFDSTQENIDLFEKLQKDLVPNKNIGNSLASYLVITKSFYDKKTKSIYQTINYGYNGTYNSCRSWLNTDISRMEKLLKIR